MFLRFAVFAFSVYRFVTFEDQQNFNIKIIERFSSFVFDIITVR